MGALREQRITSGARAQSKAIDKVKYYDSNAQRYFDKTVSIDIGDARQIFLDRMPANALLLDAGSGSGRDTKAFLSAGHKVEAFDASAELAKLSTEFTGVRADVVTFESWLVRPNRYDGIWAFASLLHVAKQDLPDVFRKLRQSLKPGGWLFASFKYGAGHSKDRFGRKFINLTPMQGRKILQHTGFDSIKIYRVSGGSSQDEKTDWVYLLAQSNPSHR